MTSHGETLLQIVPNAEMAIQGTEINHGHLRNALQYIGRTASRMALSLSLAVSGGAMAGTIAEIVEPNPQAAHALDVNGYPDADALDCSNKFGRYSWCKDENGNSQFDNGEQSSSRGYDYRNCTDFVAWLILNKTGRDIRGMSHATLWDNNAASRGLTVRPAGEAPQAGDIAHWEGNDAKPEDGYGHVGIVVSTDPLKIAEYNGAGDGNYRIRPNNSGIDHYIKVPGLSGETAGGGEAVAATLAKPAAIVYNGALNVFVRGGSGDIFHQYWNGNNWTGYSSIGNGMAGDPTLLVHNNALSVFARGNDHQIYTKSNSGSGWNGWVSLGAQTMKGNPRVVQYGDEVALFALGSNSQPYKNSWFPNTGWTGWTNMGDYMDSSPSPVQHGGNLNVLMRGSNSQVYNNTWNGNAWTGFGSLGGIISGNPDVLSYGNHLNVVVNTPSQQVYMNTWNGAGWGGWANHGGNVVGGPEGDLQGDVEVMKYNNDMEFFVRGNNKHIYTRWWSDAGQNWGGWHDLGGGNLVGDPTAIQYGTELSVFVTGEDGGTYKNTFHPNQGWGGFTRLPG